MGGGVALVGGLVVGGRVVVTGGWGLTVVGGK